MIPPHSLTVILDFTLANASSLKSQLVQSILSAIGALPLSFLRLVGAFLAQFARWTRSRAWNTTATNIDLCFPDSNAETRESLAKQSLSETGKLGFEMCAVWSRSNQWLETQIREVNNEQMVHEALANGRGLVILAPHLGNWEVLGKFLPRYAAITSLYQPPKQASLEPMIKAARETSGATLVPTSQRGVAKLLKHLKGGGITGILPDQVPAQGSGVFADFFGHSAYTMTLVHGLLRRTEAAVLVGVALRCDEGFDIHFLPVSDAIYDEDSEKSCAAMNAAIEDAVRLAPEQYQWEYKRFRRSPGNLYARD